MCESVSEMAEPDEAHTFDLRFRQAAQALSINVLFGLGPVPEGLSGCLPDPPPVSFEGAAARRGRLVADIVKSYVAQGGLKVME